MAHQSSLDALGLLQSLTLALEASLLRTAADPSEGSVHHLRTGTRRMESHLVLLAQLGELEPVFAAEGKTVRKLRKGLRLVRREGGRVRDLDVQAHQLRSFDPAEVSVCVAKQARTLARHLHRQRAAEAKLLTGVLAEHSHALVRHMGALREALEQAPAPALTPERLEQLAHAWFEAHSAARATDPARMDGNQLHDVRKAAKLTRYLLEWKAPGIAASNEAGESPAVKKSAKSFEQLQNKGGEWHDLHTLAAMARRYHGKKSELALHLAAERERALAAYLDHLRAFAVGAA